jgi:hypothetical protein
MRVNENKFRDEFVSRHKVVDRKQEGKRVLTGMKPFNGCPCDITKIGKAARFATNSSYGPKHQKLQLHCRRAHLFMPHAMPPPAASTALSTPTLEAVFALRRGSQRKLLPGDMAGSTAYQDSARSSYRGDLR